MENEYRGSVSFCFLKIYSYISNFTQQLSEWWSRSCSREAVSMAANASATGTRRRILAAGYSEGLAAATCSHRAVGPGEAPQRRLQTTGNTRTRRAAADARRRDVTAPWRCGAGHVTPASVPINVAFNSIMCFIHQELTLKLLCYEGFKLWCHLRMTEWQI